ncbi:hypothetical protein HWV62_24195 [Athelia sp. TMB]|nr:hypothetical protein HWV62_24195 [Athelia sp. TMB]
MSESESSPYTFSTADGGRTYTRTLYGFEAFCDSCASEADGLFFFAGSAALHLAPAPTPPALHSAIQSAWLALRAAAPQVACTTSFAPAPSHTWTYTYAVPSPGEAAAWAAETLRWHGDGEEGTLQEHVDALSETWWDPARGAPALLLHVHPLCKADGRWLLTFQGPHGSLDGRGAFALFDHLCASLDALLAPSPAPAAELEWGAETALLAGAGAVLTGAFDAAAPVPARAAPPPGFVPFFPPLTKTPAPARVGLNRTLTLTPAQTAALRATCKQHGRTVTQVVDAAFALADVEAALLTAGLRGGEEREAVKGCFGGATHWVAALSFKDQRPAFPAHANVFGKEGSALFAVDGYDFVVDMDAIRGALKLNEAEGGAWKVERDVGEAFWGVVGACAEGSGRVQRDPAGYRAREAAKHAQLPAMDPAPMAVRTGVTSSLGHVEALGLLSSFTPSAAVGTSPSPSSAAVETSPAPAPKRVTVDALHSVVRADLPLVLLLYWQYAGQLSFGFHTGAKWQTEAELGVLVDAFQGWVLALIE